MKTSDVGLELIMKYEGFYSKAYLCPAKVWTIGWGTTKINGKSISSDMIITKDQAKQYLISDVQVFENEVNRLVTVKLSQEMFDALISFVYNLGSTNLQSSTLLKLLNNGEYNKVPEQFLKWNKAGGKVLSGLTKRRTEESELFKAGIDKL